MADKDDVPPPLLSDDESSEDEEEEEQGQESVQCLFCPLDFSDGDKVFDHCKSEHNFSIRDIRSRYQLDCYSYIRLINWIRHQRMSSEEFNALEAIPSEALTDDKWLKPTRDNDPLLSHDIEEDTDSETARASGDFNPTVPIEEELDQVKARCANLEEALQRSMSDIGTMRGTVQNLLEADISMSDLTWNDCNTDRGYFETYSHFGIHMEMLQDRVRTESYRDALYSNKQIVESKRVLDVGCGTAILSMFAAKAGAAYVCGVDQSSVVYLAMDIIRENQLDSTISLIKGRLEDADLPEEKFHIIISEWMGYFLLFECMLDTVIFARDKYLLDGGTILPNRCTITVVGINDRDRYKKSVSYWDDVYGFRMSCMRKELIREAAVEIVPEDTICTQPCIVKNLDLMTCTKNDIQFSSDLDLRVTKSADVTALVGFFDCYFDLPNPIALSTSPAAEPTHWKQTVFHLPEPVPVKEGEVMTGKLVCSRVPHDRSLTIKILLQNVWHTFSLQ